MLPTAWATGKDLSLSIRILFSDEDFPENIFTSLIIRLVLERLSNPSQSVLDVGNDREKIGGLRSRRNELDAPNPVPLIPLHPRDRGRPRRRGRFGCRFAVL